MRPFARTALAVSMTFAPLVPLAAAHAQRESINNEVRRELRRITSYGVFDLFTFQANDDGSVTLAGYVTSPSLKREAEKAISGIGGVTHVDNRIEVAPVSQVDDNLRSKIFRAIYRDSFLAKYGTANDLLSTDHALLNPWGDGFRSFGEMGVNRWRQGPFFGDEPVGNYAIHILVKHGVVTLAGVVDNQSDKNAAGVKARSSGAKGVNNDLHVQNAVAKRK